MTARLARLSNLQLFFLSLFWFALNFHWGALLVVMMPANIQLLNPEFRVETLGDLTGFSAILALLIPLIAGAMSDRCMSRWGRRRPFVMVGATINIVGLMIMGYGLLNRNVQTDVAYAQSILQNQGLLTYIGGFMVVQIGNNIAAAAYMGVIPDLVLPEQRGAASGWMALLSQVGTLTGAVSAGNLFANAAPLLQFGLLSTVLAIITAITMFRLHETPLSAPLPKETIGTYLRSLWISPRDHPNFAWVWITRALVMLGFYAVLPFINYYLVDVIGLPQDRVSQQASILIALILIFASISGYYGGILSDRIGRKRVVYIANSAMAIIVLLFIFCRTLPTALGVGALFGLAFGAYISVDHALGTDVLPNKAEAGKQMAVWHIAMTLPQTIAAPVAGQLISSFGKQETRLPSGEVWVQYTSYGYSAVFLLCAVCVGLGAILLRNVRNVF